MRIGIIAPPWIAVPPPTYGGTETVLDSLATALQDAGHDVVLYTTGDAHCPVPRGWHWPTGVEPIGSILPEVAHVLHGYEAMADRDVIHDHTLIGPMLAANVANARVVTTVHGAFTPDLRALYRAVSRGVAVVAISHDQRASAPDVPVAAVIHHGLRVSDYDVGSGAGGYLLFLGRMTPDKGVHLAAEVARRAGVPLRIAAKMHEEPERRYFDERVRPLLGTAVEYVGEVDPVQRHTLLGDAIALVNPIRWAEPFGLVMIESLLCGTPVLARPVGAAPEIVEDGVTGFLRADADHLVDAVEHLGDLDRATCRARAASRFSATRMAEDHLALYSRVVEHGSAGMGVA